MSARQVNPAPNAAPQPTPEQAATFHAALDLYNQGFWLLPIGPDKRPYFKLLPRVGGKASRTPLRTNCVDANTVCQWFQENPDCNPGIVCGNALLVVDIDGDKGRTMLSALPELPQTVTAITGRENGGTHYYFRLKRGRWKRNEAGEELHNSSGIDLQGEGHYVVAPPSLHPSGRRYRWANGLSPNEQTITDAPEWLYGFLEEVPEDEETPVTPTKLKTPRYDISILEPSAMESQSYAEKYLQPSLKLIPR
jgi:Bifunctional DNA primase/polymerase, N-terminal